jgi:hypothetical protein
LRAQDVDALIGLIESNIPEIDIWFYTFDGPQDPGALADTEILTGTINLNPKYKGDLCRDDFDALLENLLHEGMHASDWFWQRYQDGKKGPLTPNHLSIYRRTGWEMGTLTLSPIIPPGFNGTSDQLWYSESQMWGIDGDLKQFGSGINPKPLTKYLNSIYNKMYPDGEPCGCDK